MTAPRALLEVAREGAVALASRPTPASDAGLRIAFVVPSFRRGSGGHHTISDIVRGLEARGHHCSIWVEDDEGRHDGVAEQQTAEHWLEFFGQVKAPRHVGFEAWSGCDVAVATAWQTTYRTLRLPGVAARAYLVQDHEPDFYGASAERAWAEQTYRMGLRCIAASSWLAALLRDDYGATATHFDLGIDHATYRPDDGPRDEDLVVFYARATTPRRAVPLGLLALEELVRGRPATRIALFGDSSPVRTGVVHEHLGVLERDALAALYRRATLGVVLSLTNPSLVPTEMLACGLPCVDLASASMLASFGADGPIALAAADPISLAATLARLLDDRGERERRSELGCTLAARRTWDAAAGQVEAGLRLALAEAPR